MSAPSSASNKWENGRRKPTLKLVMGTLFLVTLPIEIGFLAVLRGVGWLEIPFLLIGFFLLFFCVAVGLFSLESPLVNQLNTILAQSTCQVGASLSIAKLLTNFLWSKGYDPDTYAMPVHSATMDLIGQLLLVACYELVNAIGGKVRMAPSLAPSPNP